MATAVTTFNRSYLKNRILVQGRGGAEFQPAGILLYFEELKQGPNKEIGPKDIFEIASNNLPVVTWAEVFLAPPAARDPLADKATPAVDNPAPVGYRCRHYYVPKNRRMRGTLFFEKAYRADTSALGQDRK